ncbi:hypothetical protein C8J57DRAFT_1372238 [Mycena rebaudengoi]|nr:hypothetical protein C8J57DRAFT_1372238 [Mycena rebaudengoi]
MCGALIAAASSTPWPTLTATLEAAACGSSSALLTALPPVWFSSARCCSRCIEAIHFNHTTSYSSSALPSPLWSVSAALILTDSSFHSLYSFAGVLAPTHYRLRGWLAVAVDVD